MTIEGLKQRDLMVFNFAHDHGFPIMTTLAGGYAEKPGRHGDHPCQHRAGGKRSFRIRDRACCVPWVSSRRNTRESKIKENSTLGRLSVLI